MLEHCMEKEQILAITMAPNLFDRLSGEGRMLPEHIVSQYNWNMGHFELKEWKFVKGIKLEYIGQEFRDLPSNEQLYSRFLEAPH